MCPVVAVGWSEAMALSRLAATFPDSLKPILKSDSIKASLTPSTMVRNGQSRPIVPTPCSTV